MKKIISIVLIFMTIFLNGCAMTNKIGWTNSDFDYIKDGMVTEIKIQNTRDKGYTFVISDQVKLQGFYKILSSAKGVKSKSEYVPDYNIEIEKSDGSVEKFNYVIGNPNDGGNFYSKNKFYNVSSRLDSEVFNYFEDIRKPKDFDEVYYYGVIRGSLNKFREDTKTKDKVTLNLNDDVTIQKYITSIELEGYKKKMKDLEIVETSKNEGQITMSVKTTGFRTDTSSGKYVSIYKAIITFHNRGTNEEKVYYSVSNNSGGKWVTDITDSEPKGF
ncbi:hypothetical protein [uncultured Clostridium sp.]|uniref:hypothetical protein n=1 Tax=uncultured Clostridium sp. TaxID=59620 RepID=UPI0025CE2C1B|nr:hypothetical protein [uncultured Clostridium sp.]